MSVPKSRDHDQTQPHPHNSEGGFRGYNSTNNSNSGAADSDDSEWLPSDRHAALAKLKQLVSPLPQLRKEAILNEIRARQKRRELGFKRNDVSASVDGFTRELQRLQAERQFDLFPQLLKLANDFQYTRDIMGPIEADYNDVEQEVEGIFSDLQLAEESVYEYLDALLQSKDVHLSDLPSVPSSHHELSFATSNGQFPDVQYSDTHYDTSYQPLPPEDPLALEELLPDSTIAVEQSDDRGQISVDSHTADPSADTDRSIKSGPRPTGYSYYSASTFNGAIDRPLASIPEAIFHIPAVPYQLKPLSDIEYYPKLLLDFSTVRHRVTQWLLHSVLVSRWEAEHLKYRLDRENPKAPSNWAQLVLTFWAIDAATEPDTHKHQTQDTLSWQIEPSTFVAILFERKDLASLLQKAPRTLGAHTFIKVFRDLLDELFTSLGQEAPDKRIIVAVRTFSSTSDEIVNLVRERLYGAESDSIAPAVGPKAGDSNKHDDSHSQYCTAGEHQSTFPDFMPKELPAPVPDNHRWDHPKQNLTNRHTDTFLKHENTNSKDDDHKTSEINLGKNAGIIDLIYEDHDTGNVERRYDEGEHGGDSISAGYVKDFVLNSAAFETFRRNLAKLWKGPRDNIINSEDCERPPTPKPKKGEVNCNSAAKPGPQLSSESNTMLGEEMQHEKRGRQSAPSTHEIKLMTITNKPDLEPRKTSFSADIHSSTNSTTIQDSRPDLPLHELSKPLPVRLGTGTTVPISPEGKANGKIQRNEGSHQYNVTAVPESSHSETAPSLSSTLRTFEHPKAKSERNCPAPLKFSAENPPIHRDREQIREQRRPNGRKFKRNSPNALALRKSKDYETLKSPMRSPSGKRAKRADGPVSPPQSPIVTHLEEINHNKPSNKKRPRKSEADSVPQQEPWTVPRPIEDKRLSPIQHEKFEKIENSSNTQWKNREDPWQDFRRGKSSRLVDPNGPDGEAGVVISPVTNNATSGMEAQRPTFGTGLDHGFSFPGPHTAFSQPSVDSSSFILHQNSQHRVEYEPIGDTAQPRGFQLQYYSRSTTPSARNQESFAKKPQNQSTKPKFTNNAQLRDDT